MLSILKKTDTVVPVPKCFYFSAFRSNQSPTLIENFLYLDTTSIRTTDNIKPVVTKNFGLFFVSGSTSPVASDYQAHLFPANTQIYYKTGVCTTSPSLISLFCTNLYEIHSFN